VGEGEKHRELEYETLKKTSFTIFFSCVERDFDQGSLCLDSDSSVVVVFAKIKFPRKV
jgi:hypothetical protein